MNLARLLAFIVVIVFFVAIGMNAYSLSGGDKLVEDITSGEIVDKVKDFRAQKPEVKEVPDFLQPLEVKKQIPTDFPDQFSIDTYESTDTGLIKDATVEEIKSILSKGNIVVAHLDTTTLNNPFYSEKAKVYVTVIGYTDTHFVTSESGIRNGNAFIYLIDDFMEALTRTGGDVIYLNYSAE